jgi:putative ABC transport system permease protein
VPVWASEAALDLRGLDVGTVFDLPLGGQVVQASVRGLWRDYERPGGSVVMPRDVFVRYTGDTRATTAALWLERGAEPDAVGFAHPGGAAARRRATRSRCRARSAGCRCGCSIARSR